MMEAAVKDKIRGLCFNTILSRISLGVAAVMCAAVTAHAAPRNLYRETFGFCTGSIGKDAASETNWVGFVQGLPVAKVSNFKVFSYGVVDVGGSVNSNPIGLSQGYGFWFKPVYGLTIFTAEFPFDVGLLKATSTKITYRQRLSGIDMSGVPNKTHLAFLIGDAWYISADAFRQTKPGSWETASFTPGALAYGTVPYVEGRGPAMPPVFGAPLPAAGQVRAFGIFMDEVNGRVRLDNFVINGEPLASGSITDDIQEPDVSLCPAGSSDRTGQGGGGQQPPDDDDSDSGVDQFTPDEPTPTPTPTPQPTPSEVHGTVYLFCPIKEQGTGKAIALSTKARQAITRKVSTSTLQDLRDRAILSIIGQRALPLGSFVNVKRGDYNDSRGVLTLSVRAKAKPIPLRLRGAAKQALGAYLAHPTAPREITAPLFVEAGLHAQHVSTQRALCMRDVRAMLRARARQAKVAVGGITGR
jgi:hypothetical protein